MNIGFVIRNDTNDACMGSDGGVVVHDDAIASGAIDGTVSGDDLDTPLISLIGCRGPIGSQIGVDANIVFCEDGDVPSSCSRAVDGDDVGIDDDITGGPACFDQDRTRRIRRVRIASRIGRDTKSV